MNSKNATPIPGAIEQLQRQLDEFRNAQPHRTKLPETLWQAAVELARQHGVYSVAHPLRLDYRGLKKRLDGVPVLFWVLSIHMDFVIHVLELPVVRNTKTGLLEARWGSLPYGHPHPGSVRHDYRVAALLQRRDLA